MVASTSPPTSFPLAWCCYESDRRSSLSWGNIRSDWRRAQLVARLSHTWISNRKSTATFTDTGISDGNAMEPIASKIQRANVIVALMVGVAFGTAGTLLAKHDFRHRKHGWLRISLERTEPLSRIHIDGVIQDQKAELLYWKAL